MEEKLSKSSDVKIFRSTTDEWINHKEKINMAKFKITATAMTTVIKEIEAPTKEEAESIFYDDTYQNIVEDADEAYITDISTDRIEATSVDYEVHITAIQYDLDEEDGDPGLPKELTLWVESDGDKDDVDFDDAVRNAIEDEVGWMVKNFRYKVLSSK